MKFTGPHTGWSEWSTLVERWGPLTTTEVAQNLVSMRIGVPWERKHALVLRPKVEFPTEQEEMEQPIEERPQEALLVENHIKSALVGVLGGLSAHADAPSTLLGQVILKQSERLAELSERVSRIESTLKDVVKGIEQLRVHQPSVWVPIQSLAPEPYKVLKSFTAVVTPDGEEFEASFFDANLYGSGDTEEEAVSDLKAVVIESFERLSELEGNKLGPAMLRQKRVLAAHIRRTV